MKMTITSKVEITGKLGRLWLRLPTDICFSTTVITTIEKFGLKKLIARIRELLLNSTLIEFLWVIVNEYHLWNSTNIKLKAEIPSRPK